MTDPRLKAFQVVGRDFLARRSRACLADDMRLGKTWQAISACDKARANRVFVVCPASAVGVWESALKLLSPERNVRTGKAEGRRPLKQEVWVASYDCVRDNLDDFLEMPRWDVLICDESHMLKSLDAGRTKAIMARYGMAWRTDRLWLLSGTPAPSHAGELWVMARVFGITTMRYDDWVDYFCYRNGQGKPTGTKRERIPRLREMFAPVLLRRLKAEVAPELPKTIIEPWPVVANTEYISAMRPFNWEADMRAVRTDEYKLRMKLDQCQPHKRAQLLAQEANDFSMMRRINALLKTPAVVEAAVNDIKDGGVDKLVIYAYHSDPIRLLQLMLEQEGIRTVSVTGQTTAKGRSRAVQQFNQPDGPEIFLGQIIAAGTAIDLSVANHGILLERDWVPGNNAQALDRMGGFKQTKPVTIRDAVLTDGIDCVIGETLRRKEQEIAALLD